MVIYWLCYNYCECNSVWWVVTLRVPTNGAGPQMIGYDFL
jgi:hypothetical protein